MKPQWPNFVGNLENGECCLLNCAWMYNKDIKNVILGLKYCWWGGSKAIACLLEHYKNLVCLIFSCPVLQNSQESPFSFKHLEILSIATFTQRMNTILFGYVGFCQVLVCQL